MYLHEAHATGRRYRRKGGDTYCRYRVSILPCDGLPPVIEALDAIADDWEVEPEHKPQCIGMADEPITCIELVGNTVFYAAGQSIYSYDYRENE